MTHDTILTELELEVRDAIRAEGLRSYARRAAASPIVAVLVEAQQRLDAYLTDNPDSDRAWRLMSLIEESLLHYSSASVCLEHAIKLSGASERRDVKRLAMLKVTERESANMPLDPTQLQSLAEHLVQCGADQEVRGRTLRFTDEWLSENGIVDKGRVFDRLRDLGGTTDFSIFHNLAR